VFGYCSSHGTPALKNKSKKMKNRVTLHCLEDCVLQNKKPELHTPTFGHYSSKSRSMAIVNLAITKSLMILPSVMLGFLLLSMT
jgi:hypothetical protein